MSGQDENNIHYSNLNFENISHSAISLGGDAIVNIYNYGPKRHRPDYINIAPPPTFFVERPKVYNALKTLLLNQTSDNIASPIAISATAALRGVGGPVNCTIGRRKSDFEQARRYIELGVKIEREALGAPKLPDEDDLWAYDGLGMLLAGLHD